MEEQANGQGHEQVVGHINVPLGVVLDVLAGRDQEYLDIVEQIQADRHSQIGNRSMLLASASSLVIIGTGVIFLCFSSSVLYLPLIWGAETCFFTALTCLVFADTPIRPTLREFCRRFIASTREFCRRFNNLFHANMDNHQNDGLLVHENEQVV